MKEILNLSALQLGRVIREGEVSIPEVTQRALEAAGQDPHNSFITLNAEQAMARAEGLQRNLNQAESPLYGVPTALKDNICTRGVRTTCASKMLGNFTPPYSASVVELLANAGTVSIGKTNMDEFAMGSTGETSFFGPTTNPRDPTRAPGGSSSGSASAVAAGIIPFALGSDTGGSVRQPAAHCGLTGITPTYGTVSRYGLIAHASSLDQIGPLCKDAADCAAVLDTIQMYDRHDSTSLNRSYGNLLNSLNGDMRGLRVGIPVECFSEGLNDEVRRAVLSASNLLASRGAIVKEFSFSAFACVVPTYYIIACAEASSNLARYDGVKYGFRAKDYADLDEMYRKTRTEGFGSEVKRRILLGTFVLSSGYYDAYYNKALQAKAMIQNEFRNAFQTYDLLLTPTTPTTAPKLNSLTHPLQMYLGDIYTAAANLAGLPALSMPCGFDQNGLPIGAQLIGPHFGETVILNAAHAFQLETNFHTRRCLV